MNLTSETHTMHELIKHNLLCLFRFASSTFIWNIICDDGLLGAVEDEKFVMEETVEEERKCTCNFTREALKN